MITLKKVRLKYQIKNVCVVQESINIHIQVTSCSEVGIGNVRHKCEVMEVDEEAPYSNADVEEAVSLCASSSPDSSL